MSGAVPQPEYIVKVELPDPQGLDADIRKYFAKCEEKLGLVGTSFIRLG